MDLTTLTDDGLMELRKSIDAELNVRKQMLTARIAEIAATTGENRSRKQRSDKGQKRGARKASADATVSA